MSTRVWPVLLFALLLGGCKKDSDPEAEIRAAIERTARAAEAKDVGGVMEVVSETYAFRNQKRDDVKRLVFAGMHRGSWKKVFLLRTTVALVDETNAKAETTAVLAAGGAESVKDAISANSGTYKFELTFRREDGDWKVTEVHHSRANLKDLLGGE